MLACWLLLVKLLALFLVERLHAIRPGLRVELPELLHLVRITPSREPPPAWLSSMAGTASQAARLTRGRRSAARQSPSQ